MYVNSDTHWSGGSHDSHVAAVPIIKIVLINHTLVYFKLDASAFGISYAENQ